MKKYLTLAMPCLLLISTPSLANNAQKINFVKKFYAPFTAENDYAGGDSSVDVILKYADPDLKKLLLLEEYEAAGEQLCIGEDIRLKAQDWYEPKFSYNVDNQGLVVVTIKDPQMYNYNKQVKYKLSGQPGKYKVSDIIYQGVSFKQDLKNCLETGGY